MQLFISHSSADADVAVKVCELLERNDIPCFIAPRDIRSGKEYAEELVEGIDHSSAMILLMSKNANNSPHVLREVERAVSKSIPILVYKLEDVVLSKSMEYFLMTHQWINAGTDENYIDILRFANDLKQMKKQPEKAAPDTSGKADGTHAPKAKKRALLFGAAALLCLVLVLSALFIFTKKSNVLYDADSVSTTDLVYLLSLDELQWFDDAGISKLTQPTEAAVEQDASNWYLLDYNEFHVEECSWWLREPVSDSSSKCYLVGNGYTKDLLRQENAGLEGFGVRPALTVDVKKLSGLLK